MFGIQENKRFFFTSVAVLFVSFAFNAFSAMDTASFVSNYKDSEALVVNQINCSGDLYADQMLEQINPQTPLKFPNSCSTSALRAYSSQFGLQGKLDTFLYTSIMRPMHVSAGVFVVLLELGTALISALVLALLVLWVRRTFGKIPAVTTGILIALSPMLIGFSRNLYWALPLLIAPIVYVLYFYKLKAPRKEMIIFWTGLFVLLYLRYLCGYEYITTITVMIVATAGYTLALAGVRVKKFVREAILIGLVSAVAFGAALVTHIAALNVSTGSTEKSVSIIKQRAQERTLNAGKYVDYPYANLEFLASDHYKVTDTYVHYDKLKATGSRVWATLVALSTYLLLPVVHLPIIVPGSFSIYLQSTTMFTIVLFILYVKREKWVAKEYRARVRALFVAASLGLIGYLTWLIFGYSHALVHAHINGILIYLPYALFGFMIIGIYVEYLINRFIKKQK